MSEQLTASTADDDPATFLASGEFVDSGHPAVVDFARRTTEGAEDALARALALYGAVRDAIRYDPYIDFGDAAHFRASDVLGAGRGFCVGKAAVLAASCRAVGIPARVGYADVRNHMTSRRLHALLQTDVFSWHSYTDVFLDGAWVKATPAFDAVLCARLGIPPLEFDGRSDSLFQATDPDGRRRMEYLHYRGSFADVPFERIVADFRIRYPALMAGTRLAGDFRDEARAAE
jgi:transglutaminase-like putative cysteine protease